MNDFAADHTIVVDLGFGDAGKGTVVDRLTAPAGGARPVRAVVRFNGGAQAAHNVVTDDGRHHTFAQFGSGTLNGVPTHLSRFVLVDPLALTAEADHLTALGVPDPYALLTVDRAALLTTPYHAAAGRQRERARGAGRHGSCGMGIGETAAYALAHPADAPTAGDCASRPRLLRQLTLLRDRLTDELGPLDAPPVETCAAAFAAFARTVDLVDDTWLPGVLREGPVVLEGAQGVLLDEWHGFHPYTTWSTTTFANAETLLAEAGAPSSATRLGVVRTHTTRHGPGPLVTEDADLSAALPEPHNGHGRWQGAFRTGHFDAVAHAYAVAACAGVDALAVTHLDAPARHPGLRIARAYAIDGAVVDHLPPAHPGDLHRQEDLTRRLLRARPAVWDTPGPDPREWTAAVSEALGAPVVLESHGPTASAKRTRPPQAHHTRPPQAKRTRPPQDGPTRPLQSRGCPTTPRPTPPVTLTAGTP
ncbi:adenylosuccinate synthetase [Streptantibioticus parmotrematis]|uniref:adenylosuccinate synthetase n=1 Tax=Streptantibioticus parmotrematis TaxID=2873249 RepID=UPI003409F2EF